MTYNIPYSFIPGTKAKAQEVNANFKYLADSLTDINGEKMNKTMSNITQDAIDVIKNNAGSSRNIGEIIASTMPLEDSGLHLLDGSLLSGTGIYSEFVDYIGDLYNELLPDAQITYNLGFTGNLTINNGIITNFNSNNYAISEDYIPLSDNIEVIIKCTPFAFERGHSVVYSNQNNSGNNPVGFNNVGVPQLYGTNWINGVTTYTANQTIWLKIVWNGTSNILYSMADNDYNLETLPDSWIKEAEWTGSSILSGYYFTLGRNFYTPNEFLNGSIDLNDFCVKVDGLTWMVGANKAVSFFTNENTWQQSVTDYGVCGKFVYDRYNNTVRLPKLSGILQATTNTNAIGEITEAGLPNITGNTLGANVGNIQTDEIMNGIGALYQTPYQGDNSGISNGSNMTGTLINIDASRCCEIFGKSNTVQPQTTKVLYYIVVANSYNTDIQIDIDNIVYSLLVTSLPIMASNASIWPRKKCLPFLGLFPSEFEPIIGNRWHEGICL